MTDSAPPSVSMPNRRLDVFIITIARDLPHPCPVTRRRVHRTRACIQLSMTALPCCLLLVQYSAVTGNRQEVLRVIVVMERCVTDM